MYAPDETTTTSWLIQKTLDPNRVPGLKASLPELTAYEEEIIAEEPGRVVVLATAPEAVARRIEEERLQGVRPHIKSVEENTVMAVPVPPGVEEAEIAQAEKLTAAQVRSLLGIDKVNERGGRGRGRRIGVIDTGYSEETARQLGARIIAAESRIPDEGPQNAGDTHGDWCLQMIAYLAPEAELVVLKGLSGGDGHGSTSGIIACIRRARELGCTDISMSLGGGANQAMDDAVNAADAAGLLVCVAAGNDQRGKADDDLVADRYSPARAKGVLTIAAAQSDLVIAAFSSHGACVDGSALGFQVEAPNVTGFWSGTSMATPEVAAGAACVASTGLSKDATKQAVLAKCRDTAEPAYEEGRGFFDFSAALQPKPVVPPEDGKIGPWEYAKANVRELNKSLTVPYAGKPIHKLPPVDPYPFPKSS